jgi:hypothetical protein
LNENDLVIFNIGIWYHKPDAYREALLNIKNGVSQKLSFPALIFLESTPQHFYSVNATNGYYDTRYTKKGTCAPFPDVSKVSELDWRNVIANEVFRDSNFTVLPIAIELYSQHDAHIGKANHQRSGSSDCTHFCTTSGIFRFVLRKIYNFLVEAYNLPDLPKKEMLLEYHLPDHSVIGNSIKTNVSNLILL